MGYQDQGGREASELLAQRDPATEATYHRARAAAAAALATARQRGTDPERVRRLAHYIDVLDQSFLAWTVGREVDRMQRGAA